MLLDRFNSVKDIKRLHTIASTMAKYGFSDAVHRMGLGALLEKLGSKLHMPTVVARAKMTTPQRICHVFIDLGPTFVKLGQVLATRVDIFPPDWIEEFKKLQDQVPALPYKTIKQVIIQEFNGEPRKIFKTFDAKPVAAASIGQAHKATLDDGTEVIVKIMRPGIEEVIAADLRLIQRLAKMAGDRMGEIKQIDPVRIAREFSDSLSREIDLSMEAKNLEKVGEKFQNDKNIVIPKAYWDYTTKRVITQECINGIPGKDIQEAKEAGIDTSVIAKIGTEAILKMIFRDGFYHADPHPGNTFYLKGNKLALIDFGMVGRLNAKHRDEIVSLLYGIASEDVPSILRVLEGWIVSDDVNLDDLEADVEIFVEQYHDLNLENLNLSTMLQDLTKILRMHNVVLPSSLTLLIKVFITLEGFGRLLDPKLNMLDLARPYLKKEVMKRYSPKAVKMKAMHLATEYINFAEDLPTDLRRLLKIARVQGLKIRMDESALNRILKNMSRGANRISSSLIIAAFIIASGLLMTVESPSGFWVPFLTIAGFSLSGLGVIGLLISMWRNRKG